jgi:E3 ubiquitin-protein ligase NEDD4
VNAETVNREFFSLVSKDIFNPFYVMFEYSSHNDYIVHINPHSGINSEHLSYFKSVGRILGLGIFHGRFINAHFTASFYKTILKKKITTADLESTDPELHQALTDML